MLSEARTLARFRDGFSGERGPRVPKVYDEYTTRDLLVMELIEGASLFSDRLDERDFREVARQILAALYHMIFVDGLVHCDVHPGNLLVDVAQKRAILLDGELAAELTEADRVCFRDLFFGLASCDSAACARAIVSSALVVPADFESDGTGEGRRSDGEVIFRPEGRRIFDSRLCFRNIQDTATAWFVRRPGICICDLGARDVRGSCSLAVSRSGFSKRGEDVCDCRDPGGRPAIHRIVAAAGADRRGGIGRRTRIDGAQSGKIRQVVVLCASSVPLASRSLPSAVPERRPT